MYDHRPKVARLACGPVVKTQPRSYLKWALSGTIFGQIHIGHHKDLLKIERKFCYSIDTYRISSGRKDLQKIWRKIRR